MKVLLYPCLYLWMASTRLIYDCSSMLLTHPPRVLGFCSMYFVLSCDGFPKYSIMNVCVEQTSLWMCLIPILKDYFPAHALLKPDQLLNLYTGDLSMY